MCTAGFSLRYSVFRVISFILLHGRFPFPLVILLSLAGPACLLPCRVSAALACSGHRRRHGARCRAVVRPWPWVRRRIGRGGADAEGTTTATAAADAAAATGRCGRGERRGAEEEPWRRGEVAAGAVPARGEAARRGAVADGAPADRRRGRAGGCYHLAGLVWYLQAAFVALCRALAAAVVDAVVAHHGLARGDAAATAAAYGGGQRAGVVAGAGEAPTRRRRRRRRRRGRSDG
jgi:hypothetical protein